jgi:DNA-binding response OmpR family regulator
MTGSEEVVTVLFVEDDSSVAQTYKLKLELDGYRVNLARDGEQALQMAGSAETRLSLGFTSSTREAAIPSR